MSRRRLEFVCTYVLDGDISGCATTYKSGIHQEVAKGYCSLVGLIAKTRDHTWLAPGMAGD